MEASPMEEDVKQLLCTSNPPQSQTQTQTHGEINKRRKLSELITDRAERQSISSGSGSGSDRSTISSEPDLDTTDGDASPPRSLPPSPPDDHRFLEPVETSNDSCARSPSPSLSQPNKRPSQLHLFSDFNTPDELEILKSIAAEVVELKDYAKWFNSLGAEVKKDEILCPKYYFKWCSETKVDPVIDPFDYAEWYISKFCKPIPLVNDHHLIPEYAQIALAYMKRIDKRDDYEYVREEGIQKCSDSFHLNFYARLRASGSTLEPGPERLFFAAVDSQNNVLECSILDSEEFGDAYVLHPPNSECIYCDGMCYSHDCSE